MCLEHVVSRPTIIDALQSLQQQRVYIDQVHRKRTQGHSQLRQCHCKSAQVLHAHGGSQFVLTAIVLAEHSLCSRPPFNTVPDALLPAI